jgi:hypothetical protein
MAWSPPKKITYVLSIIFFILGMILIIELIWGVIGFYSFLPAITFFQPNLSSGEVWMIIGLFLMFLAWILLILGVRVRGI